LFVPLAGFGLLQAPGDGVVSDEDDDALAAFSEAGG
jgi:hypothetical protein